MNYGGKLRGFFTLSDPSGLNLQGTIGDIKNEYIEISFVPCTRSESLECASEEDVNDYLFDKSFVLIGRTNFIDMKEVVPVDETLQSI